MLTRQGDPDDWKRAAAAWAESGVTHVTLNTVYARNHHKRIPEKTLDAHLQAMEAYWRAVGDWVA